MRSDICNIFKSSNYTIVKDGKGLSTENVVEKYVNQS